MGPAEAIEKELNSLLEAQEELLKLVADCKNTIRRLGAPAFCGIQSVERCAKAHPT
jgi:hypothetical protein